MYVIFRNNILQYGILYIISKSFGPQPLGFLNVYQTSALHIYMYVYKNERVNNASSCGSVTFLQKEKSWRANFIWRFNSWVMTIELRSFFIKETLGIFFFSFVGHISRKSFQLVLCPVVVSFIMIEWNRYFVYIKYNGKLFWAASDVWINIDWFIFPKYIFWSNSTYFELKYSDYIITKLLICEVWIDFQL